VTTLDHGLPFGETADGRLLSVVDVPRGLACSVFCPECRQRLIARKGNVNVHHFAHESDATCAGGFETAVHKAAKQIIADRRAVTIPAGIVATLRRTRTAFPAKLARFDRVELEPWREGIRPDIVGHSRDRSLAIEILVTHVCTAEKLAFIEQRQISTIEIDLSGVDRSISYEALKILVLASASRKWLFNTRLETALAEMEAEEEAARLAAIRASEARAAQAAKDEAARVAAARVTELERLAARTAAEKDAAISQERERAEHERRQVEWNRRAAETKALHDERQRSDTALRRKMLKSKLLEGAVAGLGYAEGRQWIEANATGYWLDDEPNCVARLKHAIDKAGDLAAERAGLRDKMLRAAIGRFMTEDRANLWMKSRHPKLGNQPPFEVCTTPDGYKRCLEMLA
jgi:Competence protein CoiA-like family/Protein of unknown function (DUF2384)